LQKPYRYNLWKQSGELGQSALVKLFVEFAFVAAVGGIGLKYVTVAGFPHFSPDFPKTGLKF
jgi:hypothetical protein